MGAVIDFRVDVNNLSLKKAESILRASKSETGIYLVEQTATTLTRLRISNPKDARRSAVMLITFTGCKPDVPMQHKITLKQAQTVFLLWPNLYHCFEVNGVVVRQSTPTKMRA